MRRATLGLLIAAVAAAAGPATAGAAEVHGLAGTDVVYTAGPGEDNELSTHEQGGLVYFRDTGAPLTPGQFCETIGDEVRCIAANSGVVHIELGDGENRLDNDIVHETHVSGQGATANTFIGGAGVDELNGFSGHDVLDGGGGDDHLYGKAATTTSSAAPARTPSQAVRLATSFRTSPGSSRSSSRSGRPRSSRTTASPARETT